MSSAAVGSGKRVVIRCPVAIFVSIELKVADVAASRCATGVDPGQFAGAGGGGGGGPGGPGGPAFADPASAAPATSAPIAHTSRRRRSRATIKAPLADLSRPVLGGARLLTRSRQSLKGRAILRASSVS